MAEGIFLVSSYTKDDWWAAALYGLLACYLMSYFDGSEKRGDRYWPAACRLAGKYLKPLLPPLESRCIWKEDGGNDIPLEEREVSPPVLTCEDKKKSTSTKEYRGQCIYCSHPHGTLSLHHMMFNLDTVGEPLPFSGFAPLGQRRDLCASILFRLPIMREISLWTGMVTADRAVAKTQLTRGRSLLVLVGGEAEQMLTERGREIAYVANRKGFCKLALEFGIPLVPVYVFGENDLTRTWTGAWSLWSLRWWIMKHCQLALPLGIPNFVFLWRANKMTYCVGRPVYPDKNITDAMKTEDSSGNEVLVKTEVDRLHQAYIEELQRTFEFYKGKISDGQFKDRILEIL